VSTRSATRREQYMSFLNRPATPYYLIVGSVASLSALGIVMVLSASSVVSLQQSGSTYSIFFRQLMFFAISVVVVYLCSHWKRSIWDRLVRYSLPASFLLMLLPLTPLKQTINGNTSWIRLGSLTMQPSEFAKIGLILWCAAQLQKYEEKVLSKNSTRHVAFLLPGTVIIVGLILIGGDLGTTIIVLGIVAGMLFVSGLALRHFISVGAVLAVGIGVLIFLAPYRLHRFTAVLDPFAPSVYKFAGWQPAHSLMGLASGGLFGVGLGASRQKWGNLTEAHTDFIFSVIGEELGLLGTLIVLVLFAALLFGIFKTATQTKDLFSRYACAGVGLWMLMQVIINIGSTIGVLPVVGVTLPFISYGGSSLIANFVGIGYVLNVARRDPDIRLAVRAQQNP